MDEAILEYTVALRAHIDAVRAEMQAKDQVQKTHYVLLSAKQRLRNVEIDLLDDIELKNE